MAIARLTFVLGLFVVLFAFLALVADPHERMRGSDDAFGPLGRGWGAGIYRYVGWRILGAMAAAFWLLSLLAFLVSRT